MSDDNDEVASKWIASVVVLALVFFFILSVCARA